MTSFTCPAVGEGGENRQGDDEGQRGQDHVTRCRRPSGSCRLDGALKLKSRHKDAEQAEGDEVTCEQDEGHHHCPCEAPYDRVVSQRDPSGGCPQHQTDAEEVIQKPVHEYPVVQEETGQQRPRRQAPVKACVQRDGAGQHDDNDDAKEDPSGEHDRHRPGQRDHHHIHADIGQQEAALLVVRLQKP